MVASVGLVQMDFDGEPREGPQQTLPQGEGHWAGRNHQEQLDHPGLEIGRWVGQVKPSAQEQTNSIWVLQVICDPKSQLLIQHRNFLAHGNVLLITIPIVLCITEVTVLHTATANCPRSNDSLLLAMVVISKHIRIATICLKLIRQKSTRGKR